MILAHSPREVQMTQSEFKVLSSKPVEPKHGFQHPSKLTIDTTEMPLDAMEPRGNSCRGDS
ncbi:hypothetical protein BOTNAR_0079g00340 [Botryotinia narcissicola]|uniref:Uncharacterized protein n=1 Tax=Botryotinia narcissicola TaxID=278944 RepID=A0A4Z1IVH3_9HELO|nr:hypothetical protein BOTNAR_0079g00340 [Botryotinia narcissicola]